MNLNRSLARSAPVPATVPFQLPRAVSARREHAAFRFLEASWFAANKVFPCWTSPAPTFEPRAPVPPEVFTSAIVLEALKGSRLSPTIKEDLYDLLLATRARNGVHHFFLERDLLPADADCTGVAHSLLWEAGLLSSAEAERTANVICTNTDRQGVIAVYFTDSADRKDLVDPAVCANALHYLNAVGLAHRALATERFLFEAIERKAYLEGTRYYPSPDTFLFFVARLAADFSGRYGGLLRTLRRHVSARLGAPGTPLALAFRAIAGERLGLAAEEERAALAAAQLPSGAWAADTFFRYGRSGRVFGSEAVTTALALRALTVPGSSPHLRSST